MTRPNWIYSILRFWQGKRLDALSRAVAGRIEDTLWRRVTPRSLAMRPAEAKGYIRARATELVCGAVDGLLAGEPALATWAREELIRRSQEEAVRIVHRRWQQSRPGYREFARAA